MKGEVKTKLVSLSRDQGRKAAQHSIPSEKPRQVGSTPAGVLASRAEHFDQWAPRDMMATSEGLVIVFFMVLFLLIVT